MGESFVYVIGKPDGPYKIGQSTDPLRRREQLQSASPDLLGLYYVRAVPAADAAAVESRAHRLLKDRRMHGEWFSVGRYEAIDAVNAAAGLVQSGEMYPHRIPERVPRGSDFLKTMWLNGQVTERQRAAALAYRAAYGRAQNTTAGNFTTGGGRGYSPPAAGHIEDVLAMRQAEGAVLKAHGAAALTLLRRVAGESASVSSLVKGGAGYTTIVKVLAAALETASKFMLEEAA